MGYLQEARENHVKKKVEEGDSRNIASVLHSIFHLVISASWSVGELLFILYVRWIIGCKIKSAGSSPYVGRFTSPDYALVGICTTIGSFAWTSIDMVLLTHVAYQFVVYYQLV
jgi:hypothetical protein